MNMVHSRRQVFLNILLWKTCLKKKKKSYFLRTHSFIHNLFLFSPNTTIRLLKGGRMLIKNNTASAKCSTEFKIKCLQRLFAIMLAIKVYGSCMGSSNNLRYVTALSWWELKLASFSQTLTKEQKSIFPLLWVFFCQEIIASWILWIDNYPWSCDGSTIYFSLFVNEFTGLLYDMLIWV